MASKLRKLAAERLEQQKENDRIVRAGISVPNPRTGDFPWDKSKIRPRDPVMGLITFLSDNGDEEKAALQNMRKVEAGKRLKKLMPLTEMVDIPRGYGDENSWEAMQERQNTLKDEFQQKKGGWLEKKEEDNIRKRAHRDVKAQSDRIPLYADQRGTAETRQALKELQELSQRATRNYQIVSNVYSLMKEGKATAEHLEMQKAAYHEIGIDTDVAVRLTQKMVVKNPQAARALLTDTPGWEAGGIRNLIGNRLSAMAKDPQGGKGFGTPPLFKDGRNFSDPDEAAVANTVSRTRRMGKWSSPDELLEGLLAQRVTGLTVKQGMDPEVRAANVDMKQRLIRDYAQLREGKPSKRSSKEALWEELRSREAVLNNPRGLQGKKRAPTPQEVEELKVVSSQRKALEAELKATRVPGPKAKDWTPAYVKGEGDEKAKQKALKARLEGNFDWTKRSPTKDISPEMKKKGVLQKGWDFKNEKAEERGQLVLNRAGKAYGLKEPVITPDSLRTTLAEIGRSPKGEGGGSEVEGAIRAEIAERGMGKGAGKAIKGPRTRLQELSRLILSSGSGEMPRSNNEESRRGRKVEESGPVFERERGSRAELTGGVKEGPNPKVYRVGEAVREVEKEVGSRLAAIGREVPVKKVAPGLYAVAKKGRFNVGDFLASLMKAGRTNPEMAKQAERLLAVASKFI